MPYDLKKYNRQSLTTVQDGNTDQNSTSLTFVGKNFAGYGIVQNENFLYLLENFANGDPPSNPITGQIWYDSANRKLRFYDPSYAGGDTASSPPVTYAKWRPNGVEIGSVAPIGMAKGDLWFNTNLKQLNTYDGTSWLLIGPQSVSGQKQTNLESAAIKDTSNNTYAIVKGIVNGTTVFVISDDLIENVAPNEALYAKGFTKIYKGLTLVDSIDGHTTTSYRFWGTATNSEKLNNLAASSYALKNNPAFEGIATFKDDGITIGESSDIKIFVDAGLRTIKNTVTKTLSFKVTDSGDVRNPLILDGYNVIPGAKVNNLPVYQLGTETDKWNKIYSKTIYADSFVGAISGTSSSADTLYFNSAYVSATSASTANTIVARDGDKNFSANIISATSTKAQYADLAEKYEADADYEPGTVVVFGGEKEITVTTQAGDSRVAGVISTNPAYLMNNDSDGLAVALRGKVPCKVVGAIRKGDILVTSHIEGCAQSGGVDTFGSTIVGKSLENRFLDENDTTYPPTIGIIMIVVT